MTTYFIEPGDWETATGECLPSGTNGIEVVPASEFRKSTEAHEALGEWLSEAIEDADASYRKAPYAVTAVRALLLKQFASKHQAFLRDTSQRKETCEDSK
jgi:hypothetical protein